MSKRSKVSVCLASYNGEKHIAAQLHSILSQMGDSDELIVSDNGSTDGTVEIVSGIHDPRLSLINCETAGVVANFQCALMAASGDIIILSDQDDVWLPGRIDMALSDHESCDLSVVNHIVVDEDLNPINVASTRPSLSFLRNILKNHYLGCCMSFKKETLQFFLPFPNGIPMHDWWIASCCLLFYRVRLNPAKKILYRRHTSNASSTGMKSPYPMLTRLSWRFKLFYEIVSRFISRNLIG